MKKEKKEIDNLTKLFYDLITIFDYYLDDKPENFIIYSLWTIGTLFHDQFITYPYLFLNAIKGSGKSRLLRLISIIANGTFTIALTESSLFRTKGLLCLDESESLHGKEKQMLREILNSSYKKGQKIIRMKKVKNKFEENFEPEELETYRPIALANIWGMEDVLGDRCITRILEKSDKESKTKIIEDYENDKNIKKVKELINKITQENNFKFDINIFQDWNDYIKDNSKCKNPLFKKINNTQINGRNLELFFPLLMIALHIDNQLFETILQIAEKITIEKKESDYYESTDVKVYEFVSNNIEIDKEYLEIDLLIQFKNMYKQNDDWCNSKWWGRELKKLNLIKSKRRINQGYKVILDTIKAKEKLKIFKQPEKEEN